MVADLVLLNGKIVTVDPKETIAEAVAVKFGRFLKVGSNEKVKSLVGNETKVMDLKGKTVVPGLIDTHGHLAWSGVELRSIDCSFEGGVRSIADIQNKIAERVKTTPKGQWIVGSKVDESKLAEKRVPNKWDLDKIAPEHPVFLAYVGGHIYIVNSKAFEVFGVTKDTPDPPYGKIDRDPETGELTGILYETAGEELIKLEMTVEELKEGIKQMSRMYVAAGITGLHDAFITDKELRAYQEALAKGELPLRVRLDMHRDMVPDLLKLGLKPGFGNDWLRITGIKITCDGAISGRTAALTEPYLGKPDFYGMLVISKEELRNVFLPAHKAGWRMSAHANGDRAIKMYLDVVEEALEKYPREDHRHRDIHCSVINPKLLERIKKLGVIPTIFGAYAYYHGDKIKPDFGPKRIPWMFAARSFLDAGVKVAAHSDHSASPYPPLLGIHSLVNRRTAKGEPFGLNQRISVMEAIKLYTINAAYHSFEEETLGSIEEGKLADMVVLGEDILTVPTENIKDIPIDMTIVGGKIVYQRKP